MTDAGDWDEKRVDLAREVVMLARDRVVAEHRFLAPAVGALRLEAARIGRPFATDGSVLYMDPECILLDFQTLRKPPVRDYVHVLVHCLLLHPFTADDPTVDRRAWALATDIVAERLVTEVCGRRDGGRGDAEAVVLRQLSADLDGSVTAERIYRAILDGRWEEELASWEKVFACDDSDCWFPRPHRPDEPQSEGDAPANGGVLAREDYDRTEDQWRRLAKGLRVDLETYSREAGSNLGNLVRELRVSTEERTGYQEFLRQFALPREAMHVSPDEYDTIFYTYGLETYGDMPLIEPLEYREQQLVRDFVVVIDTSGSVDGDAVQRFVDTTFDILTSQGAFDDRVNVHIIQVDAAVQSDTRLTSLDDLHKWSRGFTLRGFGGTDFRPAFDYVDKLVADGEFSKLDGLIYFTDGWGTYPRRVPRYKTAFVFYDDDYRPQCVPPWAIQVVLDPDDLARDARSKEGRLA